MRTVSAFFASIGRLLQRPLAIGSVAGLLALFAALATALAIVPLQSEIAHQSSQVWGPQVYDTPLVDELTRLVGGETRVSLAAAIFVLAALVLFSIGDAVLVQAAAGEWGGIGSAWGKAVQRALPLLVVGLLGALWIVAAAFVAHELIGRQVEQASQAVASEWTAAILHWTADGLWLLMAVPGIIAADLARARLIVADRRSGVVAVGWALQKMARSIGPWLAALCAWTLDLVAVFSAWSIRPIWDPRISPNVWLSVPAVLILLLLRMLIHGGYLGALGRLAEPSRR